MATGEYPVPDRSVRVLHMCAVDFTVRQFVAPLAIYLRDQGCDVRVACTPGSYWEELKGWGLNMVPLPLRRSMNVPSHLLTALRLFFYLRREKIEILHLHTPIAALIGRFVGTLARVPVIIHHAHGFYFHDRMPRWKYRLHLALEKFAARFQDHLFCVSAEDARTAEDLGIAEPARIEVVLNGVDPARYDPMRWSHMRPARRAEFGIPEDAIVVTILGRMTREKGFFEFLEAARLLAPRNADVHFLAIGDALPSERDRIGRTLRAKAQDPALAGRFHFAGMRHDVPELLAASDIFCLPSHREGLPVSILEAMMMGLPVVATNIRGCREEVIDGTTGFLVGVNEPEHLADVLGYLAGNPEFMRRLGAAGQRVSLDTYTIRAVVHHQWTIYKRIIAERLST